MSSLGKDISVLKRLILEKAFRGELVPQDPKDEPVSVLLDRIKAERAELVKQGKIKKEKPLLEIQPEEVPFEIPEGWEWVRLGEVLLADLGGGTPSKANPIFWKPEIPWASVKDIADEQMYLTSTKDMISIEGLKNSASNLIAEGSLIVVTRMGLGRVVIPSIKCAINQDLRALFPSSQVSTKYLFYAYRTLSFIKRGLTVSGIRREELLSKLVPLPSFAEQQRIVSKIESLFALCEQLESRRGTLEEKVKQLKAAILQDAIQGKLVSQNASDEPASVLLDRIKTERAELVKQGKIKKEKPLPEIQPEEIPFEIPAGWKWVRLGEVSYVNPRNSTDDDTEVAFIPMRMIGENYGDTPAYEKRVWKEVKSGFTHFMEGDVAIAKITPCFENSKACVFTGLPNDLGAGTTELHIIRPLSGIDSRYVYSFIKSKHFLQLGATKMTGSAGQKRVPTDFVKEVVVPVPPTQEQYRIISKVTTLFDILDNMISMLKV